MKSLVSELNEKKEHTHAVLLAAFAHRRLADVHPFSDGNGRTARLLMNMVLLNQGYQIALISPVLRLDYINAIRAAQRERNPSDEAFNLLIAKNDYTNSSWCAMIRVGDKDESDRIPKAIRNRGTVSSISV
ncbi:hypothetical protein FACS189490_12970 [Clostridia bacterium]|nr:hypothetical protein FACS189490_12970 [Clostridia bacterium]